MTQARETERVQLHGLLLEIEHELTTISGLWACDTFDAYGSAQRSGCDADGAWHIFLDSMWRLDESMLLEKINVALRGSVAALSPESAEQEEELLHSARVLQHLREIDREHENCREEHDPHFLKVALRFAERRAGGES